MFQDTSETLVQWASEVLGAGAARLGTPSAADAAHGVTFHLLDITPHPAPDGERYRRLHATLRYLATVSSANTAVTHALLGKLTFAAMQHPSIQLDREPPSVALWQALGLPPQAGLLLKCEAYHDLPAREGRLVTRTIFATTPASHLDGRVVGTDGRPVDRATVAVPKYAMRASTDEAGRFHLPPLPRHESATLVVHANGRQQEVQLVASGGRTAGLVIQLDQ